MYKVFVINIKESKERRESILESLLTNECPEEDIEIVHPMMVRSFASQDAWCEATGMPAFQKLIGLPPIYHNSFVHTYIRILERIENFSEDADFGLIVLDDFVLNTNFANIKSVLNMLWQKRLSNAMIVQMQSWCYKDESIDISKRIPGTSFYAQLHYGDNANVYNKVAARKVKDRLLEMIPVRFSQKRNFPLDVILKREEIEGTFEKVDRYSASPGSNEFFKVAKHLSVQSEYLGTDGEVTRYKEHKE